MAEKSPQKPITVILAVSQIDIFSKVMAIKLRSQGKNVYVAEDLASLKETAETHVPDIVLMDGDMEYAPEVKQWIKGITHEKLCSLIAFYPKEASIAVQKGFRVIEDEFIQEPYEVEALGKLMDSEYTRILQERKYFIHSVKIEATSESAYIQEAGNFIERLVNSCKLSDDESMSVVNAAREALDNAARHGNKSKPDLRVQLEYLLEKKRLTITVRDQGPGFDAQSHLGNGIDGDAVSVARKRQAEGKVGGLGVMLMLRCVDKVEYNRTGNEVKLTKKLN
jgi:anti-sigma regulatory factor (Ser/Thr protein kinase)/CheY-like chemotaxis protein